MISKNQINFFNKNGYLIVENVIDDSVCDKFLKICKNYSENNNENFTEILQAHVKIPETLNFLKNSQIVDTIQTLLKGEAVGLQTVCSFKKYNTISAEYAWNPHQDNSYMQSERNSYISGDVILDDHLEGTGRLYVYPGSHEEDLLPFEENRSFDLKKGENPGNRVIQIPEKYKKVELNLKKGSLLIFHSHLIHGSTKNITKDKWRPILLMAYALKGIDFRQGRSAKRMPIDLQN
tara:strand:- start:155 stop:859 length:705 start_codon:yes stop_codon:yes gene_type:complete